MKIEIESATNFLVDLVKTAATKDAKKLTEGQLLQFRKLIVECLTSHYHDHWHPEEPVKGSGYRCIRINGKVDPVIVRAGHLMGLAAQFLHRLFPSDFTMWVDPHEVSYRIGENGSICVLYENEKAKRRPSPPNTPPNKKIRSSPEPPATPQKMPNTQLHQQQVSPPPQALSYNNFSPSNNRRAFPPHYQFMIQDQLAFLKEANNCKDIMRPNHFLPMNEGLFVSS